MNNDILSIADGTRRIILGRPGSDIEIEIDNALLRPFRSQKRSKLTMTVVPTLGAHWYLPQNADVPTPRPGDEIDEGDQSSWTVFEVISSDLNKTWQCVSCRYNVHFGPDEYVDHLRSAFTKTSAGTLQQGFRVLKTGIAAKFSAAAQEVGSDIEESLFVLTPETPQAEPLDALRRHDGGVFEIVKIQKPFYPGGWTEIEVHKIVD